MTFLIVIQSADLPFLHWRSWRYHPWSSYYHRHLCQVWGDDRDIELSKYSPLFSWPQPWLSSSLVVHISWSWWREYTSSLLFILNISYQHEKAKVAPLACARTSPQTCSSCTTTSCSHSGAGLCNAMVIIIIIITIILMKCRSMITLSYLASVMTLWSSL